MKTLVLLTTLFVAMTLSTFAADKPADSKKLVNVHGLEQSADGGSRDGAGWPLRCAWHARVT